MAKWVNKTYPEGCRECGTSSRVSLGRGLCSKCYQNSDIRDRYEPTNKRGANDMEAIKNDDEANGTEFSGNGTYSFVDSGGVGENPQILEGDGPYSSGERPPGFGPSSAQSPGASPLKKKGLRGLFEKREKPEPPPTSSKEKRPKTAKGQYGRRVSTADSLSDVWAGVGSLAIRSGRHIPLGRYMQFSSAVSGEILDEAVKGTFFDKTLLQPLVKGRGRFDALGAVFGPPALIIAIERDPSKAAVLMPLLKSSIRNALPMMVPAIKKVQAKEAAAHEAAKELFPDLAPGEDPVEGIIAMMFEGWVPPEPVVVEPETETQDETTSERVA